MNDTPVPVLPGAEVKLRRATKAMHIAWGCVAALVVVLVLVSLGGAVLYSRLGRLENQANLNACSNHLVADGFAKLGLSLKAPPAPNTARDNAVQGIIDASSRLADSDNLCASGRVTPLPPEPTSGSTPESTR